MSIFHQALKINQAIEELYTKHDDVSMKKQFDAIYAVLEAEDGVDDIISEPEGVYPAQKNEIVDRLAAAEGSGWYKVFEPCQKNQVP